MRVSSINSTSSKLVKFRKDCRSYYSKVRSKNGTTDPKPSVQIFPPQFRRFAETILGEEEATHKRILEQQIPKPYAN